MTQVVSQVELDSEGSPCLRGHFLEIGVAPAASAGIDLYWGQGIRFPGVGLPPRDHRHTLGRGDSPPARAKRTGEFVVIAGCSFAFWVWSFRTTVVRSAGLNQRPTNYERASLAPLRKRFLTYSISAARAGKRHVPGGIAHSRPITLRVAAAERTYLRYRSQFGTRGGETAQLPTLALAHAFRRA